MAGSSLGPFISGFSGLSLDVEFSLLVLFIVCAFAALSLQVLILRRGGASTRIQWLDSNILRVFGPIEIEGSKVEREHFAAAGMVPTALFLLLLVGSLAVVPEEVSGFALTTLLGAALGGSIKELAYSALALKRPRGSRIKRRPTTKCPPPSRIPSRKPPTNRTGERRCYKRSCSTDLCWQPWPPGDRPRASTVSIWTSSMLSGRRLWCRPRGAPRLHHLGSYRRTCSTAFQSGVRTSRRRAKASGTPWK